jgi:Na+-transporting NADH:ubiquinone oxidoreductase subunit A
VREDRKRRFLGWMSPGFDTFSVIPAFASRFLPGKKYDMTTTTHGSPRAIVPIGMFEKVMPMDIEPTFLLKALVVGDVERAEQLGCLELDEEDLALCTFACSGKNEYGPHLRDVLTTIEKEG